MKCNYPSPDDRHSVSIIIAEFKPIQKKNFFVYYYIDYKEQFRLGVKVKNNNQSIFMQINNKCTQEFETLSSQIKINLFFQIPV